jgi:hypothetical protein
MISPVGTMIGSYNYTKNASRLRHREHGVLLGKEFDASGIKGELQELWQEISGDEIRIKRKPSLSLKHMLPPSSMGDGGTRMRNPYAQKKAQSEVNKRKKNQLYTPTFFQFHPKKIGKNHLLWRCIRKRGSKKRRPELQIIKTLYSSSDGPPKKNTLLPRSEDYGARHRKEGSTTSPPTFCPCVWVNIHTNLNNAGYIWRQRKKRDGYAYGLFFGPASSQNGWW